MKSTNRRKFNVHKLYQVVGHGYSAVPFHLLRGGYAFPTLHYLIEVTRRCNLRCAMCQYISWLRNTPGPEQKADELTTDEWKSLVDQTSFWGLLTFSGGEPWVRQDFEELLAYASAKRRTHFISNGVLIGDDQARHCIDLAPRRMGRRGLNGIGISLEGPRALHDEIVNMEGAFDKTVAAIGNLRRFRDESGKGAPFIHVTVVIQEANLAVLRDMPALAADAGADVLNLTQEIQSMGLDNVGRSDPSSYSCADVTRPSIAPEELARALNDTDLEARRVGIELRLPRMPREKILEHYSTGIDLSEFECRSPWIRLVIHANGDVLPCFLKSVGNLREENLKTLWNGPEMRQFRKRLRRGPWPVCQGCCELHHK